MILAGDEPIYIIRKTTTGTDDYGNPTFTTSSILVRNALIGLGGTSTAEEVARNPVDASLTLYLPHGTTIQDGDLFDIRGKRWEKDGDPLEWGTVNNFEVGVVISVRRRRG
jgi:hypothetical protein